MVQDTEIAKTRAGGALARVVVAMSGGVDSSVAASLLVEAGFEVVGIALKLWQYADADPLGSCCSPDDLYDARRVADRLGIPFYVSNAQGVFAEKVVDRFTADYLGGVTPNPCVRCNAEVKFARLLKLAAGLEADYLATGHYARVDHFSDGPSRLRQAVDLDKDQSYFLFGLEQAELRRVLFPLGEMSKAEVRAHADERGLPTASKHESMEICFVGNRNYARFVEGRVDPSAIPPEGEIVDEGGAVLGEHRGIHRYTIGQRRGLGLPGGHDPQYVVAIEGNRVIVGPEASLWRHGITVVRMSWSSGSPPRAGQTFEVRVRHRGERSPARIHSTEGGVTHLELLEPQRAISPGQALVAYDGDEVLGGGWIRGPWTPPKRAMMRAMTSRREVSLDATMNGERPCASR